VTGVTIGSSFVAAFIVIVLVSYFVGSAPFGYLISKCAGVDIRREGSGNIGATNVLRVVGKPYGYAVFLLDFLKGLGAVLLVQLIMSKTNLRSGQDELVAIVAGVSSVVGHSYPVWLGFKGGKGVATTIGVLSALMPLAALVVVIVWLVTFSISKFVSLASILAALALPIAAVAIAHFKSESGPALIYFSSCVAALIVWRHRSNISRLIRGTEPGFRRK
jgi:glycerol-3-phosphate acyltransferase PlsY